MNIFPRFHSLIGLTFACAATVTDCFGGNISIVNPGFEAVTGSDPTFFDSSGKLIGGFYTIDPSQGSTPTAYLTTSPIPAWTIYGTAGTANYTGTGFLTVSSTEGQNVAYANGFMGAHGSLSQTLATTFQVGLTYTLKVDVSSFVFVEHTDYSISLYAGNSIVVGGINPSQLTPGIFTTGSISATINASSPFIGQPISIVLANTGFPSSGTQVQFDNVRLTSQPTAVPEPSTWAIASAYLVGMVAFGRLKRSN